MDQQWGFAGEAAAGDTHGAVDGGDGGGEDPILQRLLHGTPGDPAMESRKETSEGATDRHTDTSEGLTHNPRASRGCETRLQNADLDEKYSERNHKRASYKTFLLARESPFFLNCFLSLFKPFGARRALLVTQHCGQRQRRRSRDHCVLVCLFSTSGSFPRPPPKQLLEQVGLKF